MPIESPSNGLHLIASDHADRISKIEGNVLELSTNIASQGAEIKGLRHDMEVGHSNILEKLDLMSGNIIEKMNPLMDLKDKVLKIENTQEYSSKFRKMLWGLLLSLVSGFGVLLAEQLIRHH